MSHYRTRLITGVLAISLASACSTDETSSQTYAWPSSQEIAELWVDAELGDANAQYLLATIHEEGRGVPQDDDEALRWYFLAAEQGDVSAQLVLGFKYEYGFDLLPHDDAEAMRWYRLAAEQGDPLGQRYLGSMYAEGRGVAKNSQHAYMWITVAASIEAQLEYINEDDTGSALQDRSLVETDLTPEQRAVAQAKATHCFASNFTDCGEPD